jgi:hypothetical protein
VSDQKTAEAGVEARARELYETNQGNFPDPVLWDELDPYVRTLWRKQAMSPSTELVPTRPTKNVGLTPLPPTAAEVAAELGCDPRKHHKKEWAKLESAFTSELKKLRLLQRPSEADLAIRTDLEAVGLPVHTVARSTPGIVHVITDLPE